MYQMYKNSPLLFVVNTLLLLITNLIEAASIFSLIVVMDQFLNPTLKGSSQITQRVLTWLKALGLPTSLGWLLVIFLLFNVVRVIFQIFAQRTIIKTQYSIIRGIMVGTFGDFFKARWYFFSSGKQGTLLNTFTREIGLTGTAFASMTRYFSSLLHVALFLILPFFLSWKITTITMGIAILLTIPFLLIGKLNYRFGQISTSTANETNRIIHESLTSAKIILGFGKQSKSVKALDQSFDAHCRAAIKSQVLNYSIPVAYYPIGLAVLIISFFISKKFLMPLSETVILFYSLSRIIPLIGALTEEKSRLDNYFPSYEQIMKLRDRAKELKELTGEKEFAVFNKEIIVENLTFAYPENKPVLHNINMLIPKGKMIAIVGESGGGKSTLLDMIMRFHDPTSGRITFDGIDLRDFEINSYRHCIGYVPQDSILFNMSIRDNLLWADENASEEDIKNACVQANAAEFINKLPQGYNTVVGERGVRLSGGQIQRIALARAILRKRQLLILDEATSALDTYSERLIQSAIEKIAKETTVIVIAHRLSTIVNADYIYVLKDGSIIEEGIYPDLISKNGRFKDMVQLQSLEQSSTS